MISSKSNGHLIILPSEIEDMYHKHEDSKKNEWNGTTESIKLDKINNDVDLDDSKTSPTKSINGKMLANKN